MNASPTKKLEVLPYLLVLPSILVICFVYFYPIFKGLLLSFTAAQFTEPAPFVGLKNYKALFLAPTFWHSCWVTFIYTVFYIVGSFLVGLGAALLLNGRFRGRTVARVLMIIPYAIPDIAAVVVWKWLFDYQYGAFNYILTRLGAIKEPVPWLLSPKFALASILMVSVWRLFPFHSLTMLAALQDIPRSLYEAAELDGANKFRQLIHITLPLLRRILGILLVLTIIWSFQRFTTIWTLTQGGPSRATETLVVQVYLKGFKYYQMGSAAAIGTLVVMFLMAITAVYFILIKE